MREVGRSESDGILGAMQGKPGLDDPSKGVLDLPEGGFDLSDTAALQEAVFQDRGAQDEAIGGEDEDILIGGTTIHDQNATNLNAIRDIWTSSADYNTRVQALRTGLLNDDAGAVSSNGQQNTLFGQGGLDLFFTAQDANDAIEGEEFVGI